jgi:hypothetical protein
MSLIPSESYSFPDNFSRDLSRARIRNEIQSVRARVKPQSRRSRSVAPPPTEKPKPSNGVSFPIVSRNGTSPKAPVNGNGRTSSELVHVDLTPPSRIQMEAPRVSPAKHDETDIDARVVPPVKMRRRGKLVRFILTELLAVSVLVPSAMLALLHRFTDPTLILTMNILTIVSAVVVVIVPIIFFAIPPTLPRNQR